MAVVEDKMILNQAKTEFAKTLAPLDEASTLPPWTYTSQEFFDLEMERIFTKEWLNVGRIDEVPNPGDYYTITLLNEPLVVCRDEDGDIQVMSTVCRHRAAEVVESGSGNLKHFTCGYHLWTYSLKGNLISTPAMENSKNFDMSEICLPRLKVEIWEGFIYVNFDPDAAPLAPRLASVSEHLKNYRLGDLRCRILEERDCPFNWKLMLDNFMEFYHVGGLHAGSHDPMPMHLSQAEDYNPNYVHSWGSIPEDRGTLWSVTGVDATIPIFEGLSPEELKMGQFWLIFPHTLMFLSAEMVGYYRVLPVAPNRTDLRIYCMYRPEAFKEKNFEVRAQVAEDCLAFINSLDMWACDSMQRGYQGPMMQQSHHQGRLSTYDKPCHNIARYVLEKVHNARSSA